MIQTALPSTVMIPERGRINRSTLPSESCSTTLSTHSPTAKRVAKELNS